MLQSNKVKKSWHGFANLFLPGFLFRAFLQYDSIFKNYLNNQENRNRLFDSDEDKVFFLRQLLLDFKKSSTLEQKNMVYEFVNQLGAYKKPYHAVLISNYRKLIATAYRDRNLSEFEYYLNKIQPLDQVYERYYRLFSRQFLKSNVTVEEWESLLNDAEGTDSDIYGRVISQLAVKYIHLGDIDKSIKAFKQMIQRSDLEEQIHIGIGILKLFSKQGKIDEAKEFYRFIIEKIRNRDKKNLVQLKLMEVSAELGLFDLQYQDRHKYWHAAFDIVHEMKMSAENSHFFSELEKIYSEIEAKNKMLIDIRINQNEQNELLGEIDQKLKQHQPYLLIRLGDGESYGLNNRVVDPKIFEKDMSTREFKWWGERIPQSIRNKLKDEFIETLHASDAIGIPSVYRFFRAMKSNLRSPIMINSDLRGSWIVMDEILSGIRSGNYAQSTFVEHRCHQVLFTKEKIQSLAISATKTIIISHHPHDNMQAAFGATIIETIQIPPERTKHDSLPYKLDQYVDILRSKTVPGALVLVAAGFAGKYFLKVGKDAGAVALDVGAMADYWVGLKTRQVADLV